MSQLLQVARSIRRFEMPFLPSVRVKAPIISHVNPAFLVHIMASSGPFQDVLSPLLQSNSRRRHRCAQLTPFFCGLFRSTGHQSNTFIRTSGGIQ